MSQTKNSVLPTFISRTVKMSALLGAFIGASMSYINKNDLFSSIVIIAALGLVFALFSRWLAITVLRAWLETKIEQYKKRQAEEEKKLEEERVAKANAKKEEKK